MIRDQRARDRMERRARPVSRGCAYYGPALAGLERPRKWRPNLRGWRFVAVLVGAIVAVEIAVKIVLDLLRH
jgi:hypothetical protein